MSRLSLLTFVFVAALLAACQPAPRRVLVMDFEAAAGDPRLSYLTQAVPEQFTTVMSASPQIVVLERQDARRYLTTPMRDANTNALLGWQSLGRYLRADFIVTGSVARYGDADRGGARFVIASRLFSVAAGQVVPGSALTQECNSETAIVEAVNALAARTTQQILGASRRAAPPARTPASTRPAPTYNAPRPTPPPDSGGRLPTAPPPR